VNQDEGGHRAPYLQHRVLIIPHLPVSMRCGCQTARSFRHGQTGADPKAPAVVMAQRRETRVEFGRDLEQASGPFGNDDAVLGQLRATRTTANEQARSICELQA